MGPVLLLKAAGEGTVDPYVQKLADANIQAACIPVLDFEFVNIVNLQECLSKPDNYQGMIVTSPRAVESITLAIHNIRNAWESELYSVWRDKLAFVVGEASGCALKSTGLIPRGAAAGNGQALAEIILDTENVKEAGLPFLFPSSSLARDVLPSRLAEANVSVQRITTYQTVPHSGLMSNLQQTIKEEIPSHVVFFSPSGVDFTWDVWTQVDLDISKIKCVAIGPTTLTALEQRGIQPAVALKPTPEHLLSVLCADT